MYCDQDRQVINSLQSFVFIFASIFTFFIVLLTDKYGRLFGFKFMAFTYFVAPLLGFFGNSPFWVTLGIAFYYVGNDIYYQLGAIYINEISSNHLRSKVPIFWTLSGIGSIVINLILLFIPNYRYFLLLSFISFVSFFLIIN